MKRTIKTDPSQWSAKSRQTLAVFYKKEYEDKKYFCWRCGTPAVFTAEDQKHSYEVSKNHIDQRRILCPSCWREANTLRKKLSRYQLRWSESKPVLRKDQRFLSRWLELLLQLEQYVPYRADKARKNMLAKLLRRETGDHTGKKPPGA